MSDKDKSAVKQTARLFTVAPITSAVSFRSLKRNNEIIGQTASAILKKDKIVPYCPKCMTARLGYDDKNQIFGCMNCDFIVERQLDVTQIEEVKNYIREYGYEFQNEHTIIDYSSSIKKRVLSARIFGIASLCFLPFFFYSLYHLRIFIAINTLMVMMLLLLFAATHGYRAWQMANNKFYAKDGKQQFNHYLTHNNWFAYPTQNRHKNPVESYQDDSDEYDETHQYDEYEQQNTDDFDDGYEPVKQEAHDQKL